MYICDLHSYPYEWPNITSVNIQPQVLTALKPALIIHVMPKKKQQRKTYTLADYVKSHGQTKAGQDIGVSQAAISKMLQRGRAVFVEVDGHLVSAHERKKIGRAA